MIATESHFVTRIGRRRGRFRRAGDLGASGARLGGAKLVPATIRVVLWGALAMAVTAGVGRLFGVAAG